MEETVGIDWSGFLPLIQGNLGPIVMAVLAAIGVGYYSWVKGKGKRLSNQEAVHKVEQNKKAEKLQEIEKIQKPIIEEVKKIEKAAENQKIEIITKIDTAAEKVNEILTNNNIAENVEVMNNAFNKLRGE